MAHGVSLFETTVTSDVTEVGNSSDYCRWAGEMSFISLNRVAR